jgi:hypothetical protein
LPLFLCQEDNTTTADTSIDAAQTVIEWRKNLLFPLHKGLDDWDTMVNASRSDIKALYQNFRLTTCFDTLHPLFFEQTRLMPELSALFQKKLVH